MTQPYFDVVVKGYVANSPLKTDKAAFVVLGQKTKTGWANVSIQFNRPTPDVLELKKGDEIIVYGGGRINMYKDEPELVVVVYRDEETAISSNGDGYDLISTRETRAEKQKESAPAPIAERV